MKNVILILMSILLYSTSSFTQCVPDNNLPPNFIGIYPLADTSEPCDTLVPAQTAAIGVPYQTTLTLFLPAEISGIIMDSIGIALPTSANPGITGLPAGLSYVCDPPTCVFPAGVPACVSIEGTVASGTPSGIYDLLITTDIWSAIIDGQVRFPLPQQDQTPLEGVLQSFGFNFPECPYQIQVTNSLPPNIISQPTDVTTFEGTTVTFSITAGNTTSYQWYESTNGGTSYNPINNNGIYAGTTTSTLSISPTLAMDGNLYQCIVLGEINPPAISSSATLYVVPLVPPSITAQPTNVTTTEGISTTFSITANNATNYQWYESTNGGNSYNPISNNGIYSGTTTSALTVTPTLAMNGNRYQCLVTGNTNPPAISNAATLTIIESSCAVPTNTNVEMTTITNAVFSWDAMPNATFYQVKYRQKGTTAWLTVGAANTQRSVSITAKKYYQFKVRAQCGSEWSDFSDIQLFYTSTCDIPTGVASIYLDNTRMRVRWDNNPDEIKGKIRYRAVGITNWITQNSADGNNFLYVNDLPANATIQYKLRSNCDGNDWSAYSPLYTHDLLNPRLAQEEITLSKTKIYPNPTKDILNIAFETKDAEDIQIIFSNTLGSNVHILNKTYNKGMQTESIDMSRFANGYYFITIRSGERMETQKFMKMD